MSRDNLTAADRALLQLLAMEEGQACPLQMTAASSNPIPELLAQQLVKRPDRAGPFKLTKAGRARAESLRGDARRGSVGASPLRGVR